jgi:hypothetical protein
MLYHIDKVELPSNIEIRQDRQDKYYKTGLMINIFAVIYYQMILNHQLE